MSPLKTALAFVLIVALFAWEFARALWCTFVLGQTAAEQMGEVEDAT
jgi:hypothetical protein